METKKQAYENENGSRYNTQYKRSYELSPFFQFKNENDLTASSTLIIDFGEKTPDSKKFLPLTNIRIVNNSLYDIGFYPNQRSEGLVIPAGTILSFDKFSIPTLYSVKIVNLNSSNSISAEQINITSWKEGIEIDEAFKRMHKSFFGFLFPNRKP